MTVNELMNKISAPELYEWMAFDRINPIGNERFDLLAGYIAWALLGKRGDKLVKFIPPFGEFDSKVKRTGQQSVEEMQAIIDMAIQEAENLKKRKGN